MRNGRIATLALVSTAAIALAVVGGTSVAAPGVQGTAAAKKKPKPKCSSQKKALNRAKGKRKTKARSRYKACLKREKRKRLEADVKRQFKDQRLIGARGDGQAVNWLFCANGKYRLESIDRYGRGISTDDRWVVTQVKGSSKRFTAIIRESTNLRRSGLSVGVARKGSQYYVGIDRFGEVKSQGKVTRTRDTAACKAL